MGNCLKCFLIFIFIILCCSCEDHYKNGYEIAEYALGLDTVLIKTPKDAVIYYEPAVNNKKHVVFKTPYGFTGAKITVYNDSDSTAHIYMGLEGSEMVTKIRVVETGK